MSAQLYLFRLMDEGRADRGPHRAALRSTSGLARAARRARRAAEDRKA